MQIRYDRSGQLYDVLVKEHFLDLTFYLIGSIYAVDDFYRPQATATIGSNIIYRHPTFDVAMFNRYVVRENTIHDHLQFSYYKWLDEEVMGEQGWILIPNIRTNQDALCLLEED